MARIRTVKPQFWTSGDMLRLSDSCCLFFIGLWNYCDDEGKIPNDPQQIKSQLGGRWDAGKVRLFIGMLLGNGQLSISCDSAWLRVSNWKHQRINRFIQPDVKADTLQWITGVDSLSAHNNSMSEQCKDRKGIGKERIGKESLRTRGVNTPVIAEPFLTPVLVEAEDKTPRQRKSPSAPGSDTKTGLTWSAYASAFKARYQQDAVVNKRNLVLCSQLVDRLGKDAAPEVAAFFVSHNDGFYVKALHPLTLCLRDCEKLHTEWKLGRQMTGTLARQVEETQTNRSAIDDYLRSKGASA